MPKITIKVMVEGGKAVPGPPLGPALAQHKVNIGKVVSAINEHTKEFKGLTVPVEVIIDTETKEFEIKVGTPPVSQLIKKEIGAQKLTKAPWKEDPVGDIKFEQIIKIAQAKLDALGTKDLKRAIKQVVGSCVSCGVTVEGKHPRDVIKEIEQGKWDDKIKK